MIDLHTHSLVSDGTDSPTSLVAQAAEGGLDVIALTDHDTTAGWDEAADAAAQHGVGLVRGAELSTKHGGRSVHLLAYLFDRDHPELRAAMERVVDDRLPRLREMVELMAADGIDISWPEVDALLVPGTTPGRPHIADVLVAKGVVPDRSAAFGRWLYNGSPYYVRHFSLETADAVRLVREAGGVPVLAHPFSITRGSVIGADDVRELAAGGLSGIEVMHRDHDDAGRALAADLAAELDLVPTGSSDLHGDGKPNRLAEHTTSAESLARVEALASSPVAVLRS
ncbi:PHP domain-containing protein [Janibacter melonis]|uniref:PHP domain-containing protein n=1 Tax=Janibacter melonis TaxID=262209 RepID=UPI0020951434|nr:PHP domain-containing protein [Janibacter melonis]